MQTDTTNTDNFRRPIPIFLAFTDNRYQYQHRYWYKKNTGILIGPIPVIIVLLNRKDSKNICYLHFIIYSLQAGDELG